MEGAEQTVLQHDGKETTYFDEFPMRRLMKTQRPTVLTKKMLYEEMSGIGYRIDETRV